MNWYKTAQQEEKRKQLFIVRGISGSGKSTLSKQLGQGGVIHSTDDLFMVDGKYQFDVSKLTENHQANERRTEDAMKNGITPIVVDNTNVSFWEFRKYVELAQQYGYEVSFHEPTTPWKFDAEELAKRNQHGVPLKGIRSMLKRWEHDPIVDKVLKSKAPWEIEMEDKNA
jgi:NEDD4-binding protein 2